MKGLATKLLILLLPAGLFGQSAEEILGQTTLFGEAANLEIGIDMTIVKPQGAKARGLEAFIKRDAEGSRILLHIVSPAFLNQMKFLSHRDARGNESRWLKTSSGIRKLSESNRGDYLFDSDFTVEDLTEIQTEDFDLALLGEKTIGTHPCHLIEATPRFAGSTYGKKHIYVDRNSHILCAVDFFDRTGEVIKRYRLLEVQTVEGGLYPFSCIMESLTEGTRTRLEFPRIQIQETLPDKIFSRVSL
jgi:hypothetical protein